MRVLLSVFLVLGATSAFAADIVCSDGFRQVVLSESSAKITLNGFELLGVPSGSTLTCSPSEDSIVGSLRVTRLLCVPDSDRSVSIPMQLGQGNGMNVASVQLLNGFNFPMFNGICVKP